MRSNGGIIGAKKTVSINAASGIWSINDARREKGASNWPVHAPLYRYFRYQTGAPTISHQPRWSRTILVLNGSDVTIATATSDNCSDSGWIDGQGVNRDYDNGSGADCTFAKLYVSYGGARGAYYTVFGSNNNSTWVTLFSGQMNASSCGINVGTK